MTVIDERVSLETRKTIGRWSGQAPLAKEKVKRNMAAILAERRELFEEVDVLDAGLLRGYAEFVVKCPPRAAPQRAQI